MNLGPPVTPNTTAGRRRDVPGNVPGRIPTRSGAFGVSPASPRKRGRGIMADSIDAIRERTLAADLERHYGDEDREYCVTCERPTSNNDRCPDCGRGPYCRKCVQACVQCRRCNMPIDRSEP